MVSDPSYDRDEETYTGAKKQVAWGSSSDYGDAKHMREPPSCQKKKGGAHITGAGNQCWSWVLAWENKLALGKGLYRRPTTRQLCWGTWPIITWRETRCAKLESGAWRQSWRRDRRGKKRKIKFRSWLRLPWPITTLYGEDSTQISKILGHFLHFWKFWTKTRNFLPYALCHLVLAFDGSLRMIKTQNFWIWHGKICLLTNGQEILTGFELPKRSKNTSKVTFLPLFRHIGRSVGRT